MESGKDRDFNAAANLAALRCSEVLGGSEREDASLTFKLRRARSQPLRFGSQHLYQGGYVLRSVARCDGSLE